jgi:hypothetical protein
VFSFKIGVPRFFGSKCISAVDVGVLDVVKGFAHVRWHPFYDEDTGELLGRLGIELLSHHFGREKALPDENDATRYQDLHSLFMKFNKKLLRSLPVVMTNFGSDAHRRFRAQFDPRIHATLLVTLENFNLNHFDAKAQYLMCGKIGSESCTACVPHASSLAECTEPPVELFLNNTMRFDFSDAAYEVEEVDVFLTLELHEQSGPKAFGIGGCEVSIKALLARQLYPDDTSASVPLVFVERRNQEINSFLVGDIRLRARLATGDDLPESLMIPRDVLSRMQKPHVMYYYHRISEFLRVYDTMSLRSFHRTYFDDMREANDVRDGPVKRLKELINHWGPEKRSFPDPPKLSA